MDSVRADHTISQGYERDTTPNLRTLSQSEEGCFFSNCFSHGTGTPLSATSILTATYPCFHGVGVGSSAGHLREDTTTVAQRFSESGYHTACITPNGYVGPATGLDTGFDDYRFVHPKTMLNREYIPTLFKFLLNVRRHSAGFTTDLLKHSPAYIVTDISRRLFESSDESAPFFGYVHYNEPHRPYFPPLSYLDRYTDDISYSPMEAANCSMEIHQNIWEVIARGELSTKEHEALVAMYDAEIAYTDSVVGEFVEQFKASSSRPTVVVVTSDHGELFGHQGLFAHKFVVSDELTHVPLWTEGLPDIHHQSDNIIQHSDVMVTLLSMVGADTTGTQGLKLPTDRREGAISQNSSPGALEPVHEHNPDYTGLEFFESELVTALRTSEFKYVRNSHSDEKLYSLPDETQDQSAEFPEQLEHLRTDYQKWAEGHCSEAAIHGLNTNLTDDLKQHLQSLGYRE